MPLWFDLGVCCSGELTLGNGLCDKSCNSHTWCNRLVQCNFVQPFAFYSLLISWRWTRRDRWTFSRLREWREKWFWSTWRLCSAQQVSTIPTCKTWNLDTLSLLVAKLVDSYLSGMGPSIFSIMARCSRLSWVWNSVNPRYNSNIMHPIDQTSQGWDHPSSKKQVRFWWKFFLKTRCLKITKKSLIQHCERSELRLHFEWTKVN